MEQYSGTKEELKHLPVDLYEAVMKTVDDEDEVEKPIINVQIDGKWLLVWRSAKPLVALLIVLCILSSCEPPKHSCHQDHYNHHPHAPGRSANHQHDLSRYY